MLAVTGGQVTVQPGVGHWRVQVRQVQVTQVCVGKLGTAAAPPEIP